jgi:phosphoglycerate dehydrogenase-like enzyme
MRECGTPLNKALYFRILNYHRENLDLLRDNFDLVTLDDPSQAKPDVLRDVAVIFAPLGYYFGEAIFSHSARLKVVATNTTGVPHIDTERAGARGIKVISLMGERAFLDTITPTAELTVGLMIAVTRNVFAAREDVLRGRWNRWDHGGRAMLSRMSLGIVGLGRLGAMVAKYASAFGMNVLFYDPCLPVDFTTPFMRVPTLEELVGRCDVISVHILGNEANRHLFSQDIFSLFKEGSYFINTARGEVVDSMALIEALEKGIVAGAGVDVIDGEFEPDFGGRVLSHPLIEYARTHGNLIITPHIAGSTQDAWFLTQRYVIERTIAYLKGESATQ